MHEDEIPVGTAVNLTGKKFGRLTVLYRIKNKNKRTYWKCKCDCGKICEVEAYHLKNGKTKSCGCLNAELSSKRRFIDLTGKKFGKLTVIKKTNKSKEKKDNHTIWLCKCDCGKETEVSSTHLVSGHTQSCGCLTSKNEIIIANILNDININYKQQMVFKNCVNPKTNHLLKFDFYLPDYNCCIEYDGEQHFKPVDYWNGEEGLKYLQYKDNIKNEYCKQNNIKLIRIPYTERNKINKNYILNLL